LNVIKEFVKCHEKEKIDYDSKITKLSGYTSLKGIATFEAISF
jgi:hypothetical protein